MSVELTGTKVVFFRDRGRWVTDQLYGPRPLKDGEPFEKAFIVPSRATEGMVCLRAHPQEVKVSGRVIQAGWRHLLLVDVAQCDVCPNLDRWDERIDVWRRVHPEEYGRSVLLTGGGSGRPSEWALQVGSIARPALHPWSIEKMREFLEGHRESPPLSDFAESLERERAAGGDQAVRQGVLATAQYVAERLERKGE